MLPYLDDFYRILKIEKNSSNNTISSYLSDLKSFNNFLEDNKISFKEINNKHIQLFFRSLSDKKLSVKTIRRKASSLSSYFNFLLDKKIIKESPLNGVFLPKLPKRLLPTILTLNEVEDVFKAAENDKNEILSVRDRCILEMLYSSGLRVTEVCDLKLNNIQFDLDVIRFFGKGNRERIVPLTYYARHWLDRYIKTSRAILSSKSGKNINYVFLSNNGLPLTRMSVWRKVKKYVALANVIKEISPHTFRHSFATHLMDGGADIAQVQALLGHADMSTTEIYTHISRKFIDKEYMKAFKEHKN
tara:strand:+ start:722 stop:1627 length:906 start_codon:yes stop_codon:yes gene_type:complete